MLERFGRYPHRNAVLGRENTAEETEWLGLEDRPGWSIEDGENGGLDQAAKFYRTQNGAPVSSMSLFNVVHY